MTDERKFKITPKPIVLEDWKETCKIIEKLGKLGFTTYVKIIEKPSIMETLEWLTNAQFDQLSKEDFVKIREIETELRNTLFDQISNDEALKINECLEICARLQA